ncbi:BatD family protein [Parahaliea mediterranea]|uniref:Protein BatD n=1 Tax=Parahaliea mediterranea TaxID=651086 RepID=A0A939INC8_9GAMM|nr:BatD family protein [Parahaliea mediterranea]MBN7797988.1 protein BatD [Parahaliea mediterranea]
MTRTGRTMVFAMALLTLFSAGARAALEASVDRRQIAMGDTLRLVIETTGDEELADIDLEPLKRDFDILQRSSASSVQIVNGQRSHTKQLVVDLSPLRQGALRIPPLASGGERSNAVTVEVGPPPELPGGDQQVLFEAEVDREAVYVQGQVLLTLRIQQAINLDARSVSELRLDNAFVKPLEQNSFQRTVDGRPWLVHEIRYAIFPESSGTLEIPPQTFSARESIARRSLFDRGNGRLVRRVTEPLRIEVLQQPAAYPDGATWLPATSLAIEEQWSTPPEQLRAGQSATRTIRVTGSGLQGAQLPPVLFPATPGLKYYPDQPQISESESSSGLVGQRVDSAALVPTSAGTYRIPEVRIPWWDTESGALREAVLPGREIQVAAAAPHSAPSPLPAPATTTANRDAVTATGTAVELWIWRGVALFSALGWLATLAWLWRQRQQQQRAPVEHERALPGEAAAYKTLLAACAADQATRARRALLDWGRALMPNEPDLTLDGFAAHCADARLRSAIDTLNRELYAGDTGHWRGDELAALARELRKPLRKRAAGESPALGLYPA